MVWWLELCTDNLDDWKEAIRICGEAFAKTPWYRKRNVDSSTSVEFAKAYFQYLYETELSDGRAGLLCTKTKRSDGSVAIGYVTSAIYSRLPPTEGDTSAMERVSVEMMHENLQFLSGKINWLRCTISNSQTENRQYTVNMKATWSFVTSSSIVHVFFKRDCFRWETSGRDNRILITCQCQGDAGNEETIHEVIRESAESMNFCYMYGIFDATSPEFAGHGVGGKFRDVMVDAFYLDGIRRGKLPRNKPCVLYGIIDDPRLAKINRGGQEEIAHLHLKDNAVCMKSTNLETPYEDCVMIKGVEVGPGASYDTLKRFGSIFKNNLTKFDCKL